MESKRNKYDSVMSRIANESKPTLKSRSYVTRHENLSTVKFGAKQSVSNVHSGVFHDLPTKLNDYVPEEPKDNLVKRSFVSKPKKTLRSLKPTKPPPLIYSKSRNSKSDLYRSHIDINSAPSVLDGGGRDFLEKNYAMNVNWSDSHIKECSSNRSDVNFKNLKVCCHYQLYVSLDCLITA